MIVGDVLAQGCVIGAEHLLRVTGIDACSPVAAGVKQQRRTCAMQTLRIDKNIVQAD